MLAGANSRPGYLRPMRSSIFEINLGVWLLIKCSMLGPNSCHRFIPASLPTVEPKSLNGCERERLQYGVDAASFATDVSVRRRYAVFNRPLPKSSRRITVRDAA